ncbi:Lrp/AsnC family transcriptional regulator [Streptacidiphilus sp. PB12-B1b]|uniref:Lrp/AsnC family transcriptional regulator n=1 Tax=Streptacidiphilus sp. PB12-B1b TaxID=2705012 RepID=UPI0015F97DFE|nr:Lrp/AsnC family transcriptional regulator [Streptacidiphilus sp. PB12-B1b]QMU78085.1 Lrp/AsnC family transcriptional regulator [Streptacidiphilus sp. PB12-B1b]
MQETAALLSEEDLALVHALQLRPRASWTVLGRALGVDPVTVARRWNRLAQRGEAWILGSPGPRLFDHVCVAFVEVECAVGSAAGVIRALSGHAHALTIERPAGSHDLLVTVSTRDLLAMSRFTLDHLPAIEGVTAVRPRIVTHMFTEGGSWRISALDTGQRAHLSEPLEEQRTRQGPMEISPSDRSVLRLLAVDGRASYQALATALDTSAATVKRRIDRLVRLGLITFRCDFARPLGGWPVAVAFWARVPPADLPEVGHAIVRYPETRNCAAVTGPCNLIVEASLHSLADVLRFEMRLATRHPTLAVVDRSVMLRQEKLLGHLLDPHGRSLGVVPADLWSAPGTPATEHRRAARLV